MMDIVSKSETLLQYLFLDSPLFHLTPTLPHLNIETPTESIYEGRLKWFFSMFV